MATPFWRSSLGEPRSRRAGEPGDGAGEGYKPGE